MDLQIITEPLTELIVASRTTVDFSPDFSVTDLLS